jgi:hypothetical protein
VVSQPGQSARAKELERELLQLQKYIARCTDDRTRKRSRDDYRRKHREWLELRRNPSLDDEFVT